MNTITLGTFHDLINNFGKRCDSTILIETTKPIMAAKAIGSCFAIAYLTQDKVIRKPNETINYRFQEFFVGEINSVVFSKFMNNEISLLELIDLLGNKARIVKVNSKIYEPQVICNERLTSDFNSRLFPESGIYLKDMPTP